ncbi:hypothetical protein KDA_06780 [Dictyobacter alpinus]|uniref:RNA 2-O ribose methyltransferase substrate binding domain-containing protein n=1 Tax=Dictyobacter alpinus TaxID=2014873 RepID=A0A402B1H1_9CHLR|nr:RNA methyltransferase substrate-binding domain-containing protein [Dictyobacter alpinus]GCE25194.1 hypothetical protein KDA_06780 [Dictyobacter alpinus]
MEKQHHTQTEQHQRFSGFSDTIITHRTNPKIKQIRALLKSSERERTGLALVEGLRLVTEALRSPQRVRHLLVAPELLRSLHGQALLQEQRQKRLPCLYVSSEVFQSFSRKDNPQGIIVETHQRPDRRLHLKAEQPIVSGCGHK